MCIWVVVNVGACTKEAVYLRCCKGCKNVLVPNLGVVYLNYFKLGGCMFKLV